MRGKSHFTPFLLGKEISQLVESLPGEKQHCVLFFITNTNPGAAPHACNPSTQETKTMSFLEISGQTFQHIGQCNFSTLSQNMVDSNWERHLRTTVILHLLLRTTAHTCEQEEHTNSDNQCACTTHINTLTLTLKSVIHLHKNLNFNLLSEYQVFLHILKNPIFLAGPKIHASLLYPELCLTEYLLGASNGSEVVGTSPLCIHRWQFWWNI